MACPSRPGSRPRARSSDGQRQELDRRHGKQGRGRDVVGRVHSSPGPADGEGKGWGSLVGTRTGGLCEPHPSQRSALESLAGLRSGSEGAVVTVARSKGAGRQSNLCPNDQSLLGSTYRAKITLNENPPAAHHLMASLRRFTL